MSSYCTVGELQLAGFRFAKLLGTYNLQGLALLQAFGESHFAGFCVVSSHWGVPLCSVLCCLRRLGGHNFEAPLLCQAIGELQFAGSCFPSNYGGITICRILRCVKILGVPSCSVFFCPKLLGRLLSFVKLVGNSKKAGSCLHQAIGGLQFARSCFARISWGITTCRGHFFSREIISLISRLRFIIHLKHALRHVS